MDVLPVEDPSAATRVWQSEAPFYESPIATVLNEQATAPKVSLDDLCMLISRETTQEPPQIFVAAFSQVRHAPSRCPMLYEYFGAQLIKRAVFCVRAERSVE